MSMHLSYPRLNTKIAYNYIIITIIQNKHIIIAYKKMTLKSTSK